MGHSTRRLCGPALFILVFLFQWGLSSGRQDLIANYDLFEDDRKPTDTWKESGLGEEALDPNNFDHKSSREESVRDLEVELSAFPIIAPDVFNGQLEDVNRVSVSEELRGDWGAGNDESQMPTEAIRKVSEREDLEESFSGFGGRATRPATLSPDAPDEEDSESRPNETEDAADVEELSLRTNASACFIKLQADSGSFRFNFSQDCTFLLVAKHRASRLILNCDNVQLPNCTAVDHRLLVNNWGDLTFGRNSFIYCGPVMSQVRTTSLRNRISIRVHREASVSGDVECRFSTRRPRFLEEAEESSCGKLGRSSKIVGGRRITPGLFPYLVQLDITKNSGSHTTCSGTILSQKFVLTAAHCLRGVSSIAVYMGGTDRNAFTGDELIVQAEKFILHKNWNSRTLQADIALVKLSQAIKYTEEISPVCLPDRTLQTENLHRKTGVAAGWGRIETSSKAPRQAYRVRLPFLSDLRCFLAYRRFFRPKVMMCTESTEEKAICYGDSGGPMMFLRNKRVYQVGISSYSSSKVCGESFDVFTRLESSYVDWINSRLQSESG